MVHRKNDFSDKREDLVDADQFIQCSSLKLEEGATFKPHEHVWKPGPETCIAQESWVVIQGKVLCKFYDIDHAELAEVVIGPGDASFTLEGGHNYVALEENTMVYEYKTGPYKGQKQDKRFISN